jgi:hypothetical protein
MVVALETNSNARSMQESLAEAERYFAGQGILNYALKQLVADLQNHRIDYAIVGGMALFAPGYERSQLI